MNMATLIVLAAVVVLIAGAAYGCYKALRTNKCCGSCKGCCSGEACHCSIRKEQ